MSTTYFSLEINDVQGPNGYAESEDLTSYTNLETLKETLAEKLNCEIDELNFEECTYSAEEDFLLTIFEVKDGKEPDERIFDNISTIENSGISLDVIEAAAGVLSSSDSFDTIINYAKENYIGEFNSEADFADYYCEHYEELEIPSILQGCIDWDRVWNSSLKYDHTEHNGHYFRD